MVKLALDVSKQTFKDLIILEELYRETKERYGVSSAKREQQNRTKQDFSYLFSP